MSSVLDDTEYEQQGAAVVREILSQATVLPETEEQFLVAIQTMCLDLRELIPIAMNVRKEIAMGWQETLHHIPNVIGLHPEFSSAAQTRIDLLRGSIERRIDEELEQSAGSALSNDDSAINLRDDSGIFLR